MMGIRDMYTRFARYISENIIKRKPQIELRRIGGSMGFPTESGSRISFLEEFLQDFLI